MRNDQSLEYILKLTAENVPETAEAIEAITQKLDELADVRANGTAQNLAEINIQLEKMLSLFNRLDRRGVNAVQSLFNAAGSSVPLTKYNARKAEEGLGILRSHTEVFPITDPVRKSIDSIAKSARKNYPSNFSYDPNIGYSEYEPVTVEAKRKRGGRGGGSESQAAAEDRVRKEALEAQAAIANARIENYYARVAAAKAETERLKEETANLKKQERTSKANRVGSNKPMGPSTYRPDMGIYAPGAEQGLVNAFGSMEFAQSVGYDPAIRDARYNLAKAENRLRLQDYALSPIGDHVNALPSASIISNASAEELRVYQKQLGRVRRHDEYTNLSQAELSTIGDIDQAISSRKAEIRQDLNAPQVAANKAKTQAQRDAKRAADEARMAAEEQRELQAAASRLRGSGTGFLSGFGSAAIQQRTDLSLIRRSGNAALQDEFAHLHKRVDVTGRNVTNDSDIGKATQAIAGAAHATGIPFSGAGAFGVAFGASTLIKTAIDNSMELYQQRTLLSGELQTYNRFKDPVTGEYLGNAQNYAASRDYATGLYEKIRDKSVRSPVQAKELFDAFTTGYPFLANKGLNVDQSLDIVTIMESMGKMAGLRPESIRHNMRAIASGQFRNLQLFQMAGIGPEEFKEMTSKNGTEFYNTFKEKFSGFDQSLGDLSQSPMTKFQNLMNQVFMESAKLGDAIAPQLTKFAESIEQALKNAEANGTFDRFVSDINKLINALGTLATFITNNADKVLRVVESLGIYTGVKTGGSLLLGAANTVRTGFGAISTIGAGGGALGEGAAMASALTYPGLFASGKERLGGLFNYKGIDPSPITNSALGGKILAGAGLVGGIAYAGNSVINALVRQNNGLNPTEDNAFEPLMRLARSATGYLAQDAFIPRVLRNVIDPFALFNGAATTRYDIGTETAERGQYVEFLKGRGTRQQRLEAQLAIAQGLIENPKNIKRLASFNQIDRLATSVGPEELEHTKNLNFYEASGEYQQRMYAEGGAERIRAATRSQLINSHRSGLLNIYAMLGAPVSVNDPGSGLEDQLKFMGGEAGIAKATNKPIEAVHKFINDIRDVLGNSVATVTQNMKQQIADELDQLVNPDANPRVKKLVESMKLVDIPGLNQNTVGLQNINANQQIKGIGLSAIAQQHTQLYQSQLALHDYDGASQTLAMMRRDAKSTYDNDRNLLKSKYNLDRASKEAEGSVGLISRLKDGTEQFFEGPTADAVVASAVGVLSPANERALDNLTSSTDTKTAVRALLGSTASSGNPALDAALHKSLDKFGPNAFNNMLRIIQHESSFRPGWQTDLSNKHARAGLISFNREEAKAAGIDIEVLARMSPEDQAPYVARYLENKGVKPGASFTDMVKAVTGNWDFAVPNAKELKANRKWIGDDPTRFDQNKINSIYADWTGISIKSRNPVELQNAVSLVNRIDTAIAEGNKRAQRLNKQNEDAIKVGSVTSSLIPGIDSYGGGSLAATAKKARFSEEVPGITALTLRTDAMVYESMGLGKAEDFINKSFGVGNEAFDGSISNYGDSIRKKNKLFAIATEAVRSRMSGGNASLALGEDADRNKFTIRAKTNHEVNRLTNKANAEAAIDINYRIGDARISTQYATTMAAYDKMASEAYGDQYAYNAQGAYELMMADITSNAGKHDWRTAASFAYDANRQYAGSRRNLYNQYIALGAKQYIDQNKAFIGPQQGTLESRTRMAGLRFANRMFSGDDHTAALLEGYETTRDNALAKDREARAKERLDVSYESQQAGFSASESPYLSLAERLGLIDRSSLAERSHLISSSYIGVDSLPGAIRAAWMLSPKLQEIKTKANKEKFNLLDRQRQLGVGRDFQIASARQGGGITGGLITEANLDADALRSAITDPTELTNMQGLSGRMLEGQGYAVRLQELLKQQSLGIGGDHTNDINVLMSKLRDLALAAQASAESIKSESDMRVKKINKSTQGLLEGASTPFGIGKYGTAAYEAKVQKAASGEDYDGMSYGSLRQIADTRFLVEGVDYSNEAELKAKLINMDIKSVVSPSAMSKAAGISAIGDGFPKLQEALLSRGRNSAYGPLIGAFAGGISRTGIPSLQQAFAQLVGGNTRSAAINALKNQGYDESQITNGDIRKYMQQPLASLAGNVGVPLIDNALFGNPNTNYSQEGSSVGGAILSLAPGLLGTGLGAFAGPVGMLAGSLLGGLFKKSTGPSPEDIARREHEQNLEKLLDGMNKLLRPQYDFYRATNGAALFGVGSGWLSGRAASRFGNAAAAGAL